MNGFCRYLKIMAACFPALAFAGSDIVIHVADEGSAPVPDATVEVGFFGPSAGLGPTFLGISGVTDVTGRFVAKRCGVNVSGISVEKTGYYKSKMEFGGSASSFNFTLKRIGNPVPLFVKSVELKRNLSIGNWIGYDFEIGDWCPPHGIGVRSDIIFSRQGFFVDNWKAFDVSYSVRFNEGEDGIQEAAFDEKSGSILRLPREAPSEGYVSTMQRRIYRTAESGTIGGGHRTNCAYFIRVRSSREGERVVATEDSKTA